MTTTARRSSQQLLLGVALLIAAGIAGPAAAQFQALKCPEPSLESTWTILERDGANRQVPRYLSSLGQGEGATGVITSPPFKLEVDTISFTVRGHDGQGGGQDKNFVALVDARKGNVLRKTPAPGNDALQERQWDVRDYKGTEVRVEMHDGLSGSAYAWMGVGSINAGPHWSIDFSQGMPDGWKKSQQEAKVRYELVTDGVPFRRNASIFTVIPSAGHVEIPCGFTAQRMYLLGCTVGLGKPGDIHGGVELHYASGSVDIIPLMVGYTLDNRGKQLSPAASLHLHRSGDPFQSYLPIALRNEALQSVRLVTNPPRRSIPCISAITVETDASHPQLIQLPPTKLNDAEQSWIAAKSVSPQTLANDNIMSELRASYRLPEPPASKIHFRKIVVDPEFRSEGVAVADFNADGQLDIATGNQLHLGPDWTLQPLQDSPKSFPWMGYSDSFLCFDGDVNGDGALDLVVVGFPGQATRWMENPGPRGGPWKNHLAIEHTGNESPEYVDVDGDGKPELLFMAGNRCAMARPGADPTKLWDIQLIAAANDPSAGHGLGCGDINGDSITDVLIPDGWWQGPGKPTSEPWQFHPASLFGGAQLCVADLDGDGDSDVLGSSPHGYGIAWTEQTAEGWEQHMIDESDSQTHAICLADINRDGLLDFVTGKRFWAHNGHDPGSYERCVLCWYQQQRVDGTPTWIKHEIDGDSGVGLHFQIIDLNGDGLLDIVTSNKKGVLIFQQQKD